MIGPGYVYLPNPSKTRLIMKVEYYSKAAAAFKGTNINIISSGRPYLEAALGSTEYIDQYVDEKVAP